MTTSQKYKWLVLLISSYLFYGFWDYRFVAVIFFGTILSFIIGRKIEDACEKTRRNFLVLGVLVNLFPLLLFKYIFPIAVQISPSLLATPTKWIIPLGISYYTFQVLAYLIDIYRKKNSSEKHFGHFALFVIFFPQLVCGPIEKADNFLPQIKNIKKDKRLQTEGVLFILSGMIKKVVFANQLLLIISPLIAKPTLVYGPFALILLILIRYYVYFDFSGYTDIAIGSAKLFNINLTNNFDRPFYSKTIAEFWERWHISLSRWIKEYVFFPLLILTPLGSLGILLNVLLMFLIIGIWHGATLNFLLYGVWQGAMVVLHHLLKKPMRRFIHKLKIDESSLPFKLFQVAFTFIFLVCPPAICIVTKTPAEITDVFRRLFVFESHTNIDSKLIAVICSIGLFEIVHFAESKYKLKSKVSNSSYIVNIVVIFVLSVILFSLGKWGNMASFIYYSF